MLHQYLFPVLDMLAYPLFWLPHSASLTLVSVAFGGVLLAVYRYTSDQWAMAFYKDRVKDAQLGFFRGHNRWENFLNIARHNLTLSRLALIPSVACILVLLIIIPWIGNRFGHVPPQPGDPIGLTVRSEKPWSFERDHALRYEPDVGPFEAGVTDVRLLVEKSGNAELTLTSEDQSQSIVLPVAPSRTPSWPSIVPPKWYHPLVNPAEQQLSPNGPIKNITVNYEVVFSSLSFTIPYSGHVPGWLSWFFLVGFASGLWAKFHWEVE